MPDPTVGQENFCAVVAVTLEDLADGALHLAAGRLVRREDDGDQCARANLAMRCGRHDGVARGLIAVQTIRGCE